MKFVYPAIFTPKEDGGYQVDFPDLEKCHAEGRNLEEAIEHAKEAETTWISVELEDGIELPVAEAVDQTKLKEGSFVRPVSAIVKFVDEYD